MVTIIFLIFQMLKKAERGEKTTQLLLKLRKSCIYSELSSHKEKSFSSCKSHFEI